MSEAELEVLEMVVIEPSTVLAAYTNGEGLDDAIDQVRVVVECFEHNMSNKAGRAKTASLAHKVAKVKTKLDSMGKDLVTGWKEQSRKVDSSRKSMREALDDLKIEARRPLTEWEAEQAEIEAERVAVEEAEKLANQIESDHEVAILMNDKINRDESEAKAEEERQAKAEAEQVERDRKARESRIATEAAERATREANELAARKEAEAEAAVKAAQEAEQRAKWEHENSLKLAEQQRIKAVKDAELLAEAAAAAERLKQQQEREQAEKEQAAKAKNRKIQASVHNSMLKAFVSGGLSEDAAKLAVKLLAKNLIPNTKITY